MNRPNLFNWATSELSQDAFICWLLSWSNHPDNEHLYQISNQLIETLTGGELKSIKNVKILKQRYNIDIVCIINEEYAILIEDKTNTKNHSNQLENYLKRLAEDYPIEKTYPIYFKTGDQSNYNNVQENGYKSFLRADFLRILDLGVSIGITNPIFLDFHSYLTNIEHSIQSYKTLPVNDWHGDSWKGFYIELQKQLGQGDWDYVPQRNGGFMGFWWSWKKHNYDEFEYLAYLQLEQTKFCFKVTCEKTNKSREIRDFYRSKLYPKAHQRGIDIYQNGRIGTWMTVAALKQQYIKTDNNGFLNMNETTLLLKSIQNMVNEL